MSERQTLDCGPRGGAGTEVLSALSASKKKSITFFKGDDTRIGEHTVFDFDGEAQSVGMVQTWNQCNELLLTSQDKSHSILLMDTETGATKSELSMRRERKNWKLEVDSITPMQKFEQYKQSQGFQIFGLGDDGKTVFGMSHDTRIGENVEEFVVHADSCRKYKTYTFSCHAQTKAGFLVLGRTDGAIALYDAIMKSENASCVIDGMPGPVSSVDVSADGSMIAWSTPEFVFFTCPARDNWRKGTKHPKPAVLKLAIPPKDGDTYYDDLADLETSGAMFCPVKFDATTHKDEHGLVESYIVTYSGAVQLRWGVRAARDAWERLNDKEEGAPVCLNATLTLMESAISRHMVVQDLDIIALEGEIVKSLHF